MTYATPGPPDPRRDGELAAEYAARFATPPEPSGLRAYLTVLGCAVLPALVLLAAFTFAGNAIPGGACRGMGGGCEMGASDTAEFMLLFIAPPVVVVGAAVGTGALALLRLWRRYRALPRFVQGLIPGIPMLLIAAAFAAV